MVFITETECVSCAVRTGSLHIIQFRSNPETVPKIPNHYFMFLILPSRLKFSKINPPSLNQKVIKLYLQIVHCNNIEKPKFRGNHYKK
jgi:hypothetical protein